MNAIWQAIREQAAAFSWVEWAATVTALAYVWLTSQQKTRGWWWGVLSCSLWAYASYAIYHLYLDVVLQLFYVAMGVWGWYQWQYGGARQNELPVSQVHYARHVLFIGIGGLIAILLAWVFDNWTLSAAPWWNAPLAVFSILATYLLVQKKWESWLYWIVVDTAYALLYGSQGAWLFALVMAVYTIIAAKALVSWRAEFQQLQDKAV